MSESRMMTFNERINAIPVILEGFERFWGFTSSLYKLTTVSLRPNEHKTCVGVLFPVNEEQLNLLDERERGYNRISILPNQLHAFYSNGNLPQNQITYTYVSTIHNQPSQKYPVVQSDIDAILTGCLEDFNESFARAVVRTTSDWNSPYLNDRKHPRYPYSHHRAELLPMINTILEEEGPAGAFE